VRQSSPQTARSHSVPLRSRGSVVLPLALVVLLVSLASAALLISAAQVVLLVFPVSVVPVVFRVPVARVVLLVFRVPVARVVLLVFPVSVVPVSMLAGTVCRVTFTVSKATLQPMATAALQRMATAILHAMATAMASGDTAGGDVMTSLSKAVMATALMAMPLPMAAPTPTARGDTGVFWFAMQTEGGWQPDCTPVPHAPRGASLRHRRDGGDDARPEGFRQ
jgi:hypothetical protein